MNTCKMSSVMLFPFTEKISQPDISESFITLVALNINFEQFYHNLKQIISLGWNSTTLQFASIYFEFR